MRLLRPLIVALAILATSTIASAWVTGAGTVTSNGGGNITYCVEICWLPGETAPSTSNPPTADGEEIDNPGAGDANDPFGPATGTPGSVPYPSGGFTCQIWCFAFSGVDCEFGDEEVTFEVRLNGTTGNDGPYEGNLC